MPKPKISWIIVNLLKQDGAKNKVKFADELEYWMGKNFYFQNNNLRNSRAKPQTLG